MKRSYLTTYPLVSVLCLSALPLHAAGPGTPNNPTAYTALRAVQKSLGSDVLSRVVAVTGRDGVPQPYLWRVTLREVGGTREVNVAGGKVTPQRAAVGKPAPGTGTLRLQELNLDSSGAFDAAEAQARKARVRFDSLNYVLDLGDNGKPVWMLELFNQDGVSIGSMRLAAHDGTLASITGRLAAAPSNTSVTNTSRTPTPAPGRTIPTLVTAPTPSRASTATTVTTERHSTTVAPVPEETEGGFFTRAGRTIDHTNHSVAQGVDQTNNAVKRSLRHTGATIQRFFVGHSGLDREDNQN